MADAATEMATTVSPPAKTYTFADTILIPGVSRTLLFVLHAVFLSLLAALLVLLVNAEDWELHVIMVCVLSIGLYVTLVWFIGEMTLALREHREAEAAAAAAAPSAADDKKPPRQGDAAFGAEVTRRAVSSRSSEADVPAMGLVRKPVPPPRN